VAPEHRTRIPGKPGPQATGAFHCSSLQYHVLRANPGWSCSGVYATDPRESQPAWPTITPWTSPSLYIHTNQAFLLTKYQHGPSSIVDDPNPHLRQETQPGLALNQHTTPPKNYCLHRVIQPGCTERPQVIPTSLCRTQAQFTILPLFSQPQGLLKPAQEFYKQLDPLGIRTRPTP
jgi:hypothetical protein